MCIKKLIWDSDFFNFEIGEITENSNLENANDFNLLVLKQSKESNVIIDNFENSFQETKIIFRKTIDTIIGTIDVEDADFESLTPNYLYDLAYESGKHSRFLLDKNFRENQFKELYQKWIDNSLNKQFADKIFYTKKENKITGFVSVKKQDNFATIGLIAVDSEQQGQGIGRILIQKVEQYCTNNHISELRIPTQKENQQACHFYTKNGYTILEETIIKHYWKI